MRVGISDYAQTFGMYSQAYVGFVRSRDLKMQHTIRMAPLWWNGFTSIEARIPGIAVKIFLKRDNRFWYHGIGCLGSSRGRA